MLRVNRREAKTNLSALAAKAVAGETDAPNLLPTSGPRVLVIGAGVSGLTTARCLQQRGFAATVIADRFQSATTSVVAGALWEWPPAVCGDDEK